MGETVTMLPHGQGSERIVGRSEGLAAGNLPRNLEPFGVLVHHRVDDVDEGFIAGEKAVAAGEQVTLQPALAHVLTENFHYAAGLGKVLIDGESRGHPSLARSGNHVDDAGAG